MREATADAPRSELARTGPHDRPLDLVGLEAQSHRFLHLREDDDVIQLGYRTLEFDPLHDVTGLEVDDLQAALRDGVALGEFLVERQAGEGFLARLAQTDDRVIPRERQPAEITGAEGDRLELPGLAVDPAEISKAAVV